MNSNLDLAVVAVLAFLYGFEVADDPTLLWALPILVGAWVVRDPWALCKDTSKAGYGKLS